MPASLKAQRLSVMVSWTLRRLATLVTIARLTIVLDLCVICVRGLYRGCGPMLQTVTSSNFLYFFLFEGLKVCDACMHDGVTYSN